jgi:TRAP-type C4-dicarboxylate transport system permease small subunit
VAVSKPPLSQQPDKKTKVIFATEEGSKQNMQNSVEAVKETGFLARYEKLVMKIDYIALDVASVMILIMFVMNCADILGQKLLNYPVPGDVELTGYVQSILIPAAAGAVFLARGHIRIELATEWMPPRAKEILDGIISLIVFVLIAILIWQIFVFGMAKQSVGEYSNTLHLPFYYVIYAMGLAFVPFALSLLLDFFRMFKRGALK